MGGRDLLLNKVLNTEGGGEEEKTRPRQISLVFREFSWKKSGRQETGIFSPHPRSFPSLFHLHGGSAKAAKTSDVAQLKCPRRH